MKKTTFLLLACLTASGALRAQSTELQSPLKVSGYVQTQWQLGEKEASLKVGAANENLNKSFNRLGIRRGRLKFSYEKGLASAVFQIDMTEKGMGVKDAYLNLKDPWKGNNALRAGLFNRPFGYEIAYSSSQRESPERSRIFQTLFPDERDLGVMLSLQPIKGSALSFLKLEAGLFAGNGIKQETDSRKDFIGHLSATGVMERLTFGGGLSYYNGAAYQLETSRYAKREYFGMDARLQWKSSLGSGKLHAEYLWGTHLDNDFGGGYAMLVQDLGRSPLAVVAKYDWYEPAALSYSTFGAGALWYATSTIRLQMYYEWNSTHPDERQDNVLTLRLQYKF
ncbi:MAG: OprO/OprP family phosphate-selective porin [Prevotellaceae bacterium]|nr:OprO/OprP family phosphate-selective porin [Prevotellaceae bacterium]